MVKYVYNISNLEFGDIILVRFPGNEISERVMKSTNSEYSHAMLYVGDSSYIEADKRVVARNLARLLLDNPDDSCVLRVKNEYRTPSTIDAAISYAREVVGNPYAYMDSLRLEAGRFDDYSGDSQICTRLVAKAFARSGVFIVDNIEMCTPQQLLESKYVEVHRNFLRRANDFDIKFAESYDVTDDMVDSIFRLFDSIKPYADGKIRTMRELIYHVIKHKEDDEAIASCLKASGYLDVLKIEEKKNTYNYNKDEFIRYYGDNAYWAAYDSLETNRRSKQRYEADCYEMIRLFVGSGMTSHSLLLLIALQKQILEQIELREKVCCDVIDDPEVTFI